jgi:hypothetical protein
MTAVLRRLREENAGAADEVGELAFAVSEILRAQQRLEAGLKELAAEAAAMVRLPDHARQRQVAAYAATLSQAFSMQVSAFRELERGMDGWDVQGAAP